jgi:ribonuclease P protein subunit POP4
MKKETMMEKETARAREELIGLDLEIVESRDPGLKKRQGKIIDETLNMLAIEEGLNMVKIPKKICRFKFTDGIELEGRKLNYRPEDRIKKVR